MISFDFFWNSSFWGTLRARFPFTLFRKAYWKLDFLLKEFIINQKISSLKKKENSLSCEKNSYSFGSVYISLTTYPARIESAYYAIYSILDQTVRPNKIILTLINDEFPEGESSLPQSILSLKEKGLEILWARDNLRPHNKYFYSMQKYPDALIITIDDDILYPSDTIEKLIKCYKKFPNAISAFHTDKFAIRNNRLDKYSNAIIGYRQEIHAPKHSLLAEGFAGVLYPPSILPQDAFDKNLIQRCSPMADDIWLKCIELKNNIPVVCASPKQNVIVLGQCQESALFKVNRERNFNDEQLESAQDALGINIQSYD